MTNIKLLTFYMKWIISLLLLTRSVHPLIINKTHLLADIKIPAVITFISLCIVDYEHCIVKYSILSDNAVFSVVCCSSRSFRYSIHAVNVPLRQLSFHSGHLGNASGCSFLLIIVIQIKHVPMTYACGFDLWHTHTLLQGGRDSLLYDQCFVPS